MRNLLIRLDTMICQLSSREVFLIIDKMTNYATIIRQILDNQYPNPDETSILTFSMLNLKFIPSPAQAML